MSYRLLLVDAAGKAICRPLRLRELRKFPGEGLSVHFRPVRNDLLFESAKVAGRLAYRILTGEGVVRSQLWVEYEIPGEHVNVTGRSSDLLFALALCTAAWARTGDAYPVIAATGVIDVDGSVLSVESPAAKIAAAVEELGAGKAPAVVFYPAVDASAVAQWRETSTTPPHIQLRPVDRVEDALAELGCSLEKVYLRNPFRGLEHFDYEHHAIFFGRDKEIREVLEQLLRREAAAVPGLLVEGTSGSGKSSFLRAGILPTLVDPRHQTEEVQARIAHRPVSAGVRKAIWRPGLMASGADEVAITRSVAECWEVFAELSSEDEASPPRTLAELARIRLDRWSSARRFVWVIDQFEEILTLELGDSQLENLGKFLVQLQNEGVWTLACVRSDALPVLKRHEMLRRVFGSNEGQFYLATLSGPALDDVISRPAKAADLTFALDSGGKGLDQILREEVYREQDSLPLLQFTLNELYIHRSGRELTYAAYQRLGGMAGSVATTAEAILKSEGDGSPRVVPRLFRNLVSVDETGKATRRYASWSEIEQEPLQARLVRRLVAARLCVTDQREGESVVAFAHDSLLRTLPPLLEWLREEAGLLQIRELAQREARLWQQHQQSDAWLAGADKLVSFKALYAAEIVLAPAVRAFIERSKRHVRRLSRVKQAAVGLIALLAVTSSIGAWLANQREREAEYQTAQARKAQLELLTEAAAERLKDGDLTLARGIDLAVLSRYGQSQAPDAAAINVLQEIRANDPGRAIMAGHTAPVRRATYSPDGRRVATASLDHTVRIWDARTGIELRVLSGHTRTVMSVKYSRDGTRLLTASGDGTVRVWDAATGQEVLRLKNTSGFHSAAYSPDNGIIATSSEEGVQLWDATSGRLVRTVYQNGAEKRYGAIFSPDGRRLLCLGPGAVAYVLDVSTGRQLLAISGHENDITSGVWSPTGDRILTASWDNTARIWDARNGRVLAVLTGHIGMVSSAAFAPDGRTVSTASTDKTVRTWDAITGKQLRVLSGHTAILGGVEYSPDGTHLVTGGWDLTARTWDLQNEQALWVIGTPDINPDKDVESGAFSNDGKRLLVLTHGGKLRILDTATRQTLLNLSAAKDIVGGAVFSPDGSRILASAHNVIKVVDPSSGSTLLSIEGPEGITSFDYSPDGKRIVAGFEDLSLRLFDAETGRSLLVDHSHKDYIASATFSPDGARILTGSIDKTARVWDAGTLTEQLILPHNDHVNGASFSHDGTRIVTACNDGFAYVWDALTGEKLRALAGHHAFVNSAAFSPDGRQIVTGGKDTTVRIWDANTGVELAVFTGHTRKLENVAYSPDGLRIVSTSSDGTVRIWNAKVPADWRSQLAWEQAVEADPLSEVQRTHVGISSSMNILAGDALAPSAATRFGFKEDATPESSCSKQAGAYYDPNRMSSGVDQSAIQPDIALAACSQSLANSDSSGRAAYQRGRALLAKSDFRGARHAFEDSILRGYRTARVDLALLLINPSAAMLDSRTALSELQEAWNSGLTIAAFELGSLYEAGVPATPSTPALAPDRIRAMYWYRQGATRAQPQALARIAAEFERAATSASGELADRGFLDAFNLYARAAAVAEQQRWPDSVWKAWRYRRSALARVLAEDGLMQSVALGFNNAVQTGSQ